MVMLSRSLNKRTVLKGIVAGASVAIPSFRAFAQAGALDVSIAMSSSGLPYGGLYIAKNAGMFEKHGLNPRLIVADSGNAATTALLAGSVDFSGSGPSEALTARVRGQDVVIIGNLYRGLSGSLVLAKSVIEKIGLKPDAPIEDRLKALDGLSIASPSATSAYTGPVKNGAAKFGAKPKLVYMAQPAMPAALEVNAVQGIICAAPFSIVPVVKGSGSVWISGPRAQFPAEYMPTSSACLQTSNKFIKDKPEVVKRLQAMLADLATFIKQKPDEAKKALGTTYSTFDAATLDGIFTQDGDNWSRPIFTVADMQQEVKILEETQAVPGLKTLDLNSVLKMPV